MYLHRGTQPRVQGVLIDTSTQGHTTLVIDTQSGVHNLEYTTWSTGGSHWYTYTAQGYTHPGVHGVLRLNPKNLNFLIFLWMIL